MSSPKHYIGFDLGTTNSAAAAFDGEELTLVRSAQGGHLTPSVVRINKKGVTTVGARARRFLETDPENTRAEFKRLMGTPRAVPFAAAGVEKKPEELSALVLASLRSDVEQQLGFLPAQAVVTVPALFEVPQSSATAEAGRLAGFERVELLQEPVASALAAGWSAEDAQGAWLVYDLGGGTFDVSLLETRDGLLRVVGHDGDNFLGGRDFDAAVVDHLVRQIADSEGIELRRDDPAHAAVLRQVALAAEEAKIELTRAETAAVALAAPVEVDGDDLELDLELDRATLERLCQPLVSRTIEVCQRLLAEEGLGPDALEKVVLVGGPTVMPMIRRQVRAELGELPDRALDPMALVAQGAALYAATAGLSARPAAKVAAPDAAHKVWLQYPAMTSSLTPHVIGRLAEPRPGGPASVRVVRLDKDGHAPAGDWEAESLELDDENAFVALVELEPRSLNRFRLEARAADGSEVAIAPCELEIVHGLTIGDPPLSRSIGVALADNRVRVYFERGTPLPARRTFSHRTVESISPGADGSVLKVPIVQGELEHAHLCRLVGNLEIPGREVDRHVPVGTSVEVTLELDRGGHLTARARVAGIDRLFEEVAALLVPEASPDVLEREIAALEKRLGELQSDAFRRRDQAMIARFQSLVNDLHAASASVAAARGGDEDSGQKARRQVLDVEAEIVELEAEKSWPELEEGAVKTLAWTSSTVSAYGTETEARLLDEAMKGVEQARAARSPEQLRRHLGLVSELGSAAWYRRPDVWEIEFHYLESHLQDAIDLPRAERLVEEGRRLLDANDQNGLRRVVRKLWELQPADARERQRSHESGVR